MMEHIQRHPDALQTFSPYKYSRRRSSPSSMHRHQLLPFISAIFLILLTLLSPHTQAQAASLSLVDSFGYPLLYIQSSSQLQSSSSNSSSSSFSYTPANFGASVPSENVFQAVLGLSAPVVQPFSSS